MKEMQDIYADRVAPEKLDSSPSLPHILFCDDNLLMEGFKMPPRIDLTGKKFGRLTVLREGERLPDRHYTWLCLCSCGKYKTVSSSCLKSGDTKSCGCLKSEKLHGKNHPSWRGGINKAHGIIKIKAYNHIKADMNGYVRVCVLAAEKALGKPFPAKAIVHHIDGIQDNDNYHKLLHRRERAYRACGNANFRKCWICKTYDSVDNLYIPPRATTGSIRHKKCMYEYNKQKLPII